MQSAKTAPLCGNCCQGAISACRGPGVAAKRQEQHRRPPEDLPSSIIDDIGIDNGDDIEAQQRFCVLDSETSPPSSGKSHPREQTSDRGML
ncbi:hypothetical protein VTK56DRAFT_6076 [Thermocarpiscus australiensis]